MTSPILLLSGFIAGCLTTAVFIRYGIGLGVKMVEKARDGDPVFGKDGPPITQTHTGKEELEEAEV